MSGRLGECSAVTSDVRPGIGRLVCVVSATTERQGHPLCGTHAKQFDRWASSSLNGALARARFHWGWPE